MEKQSNKKSQKTDMLRSNSVALKRGKQKITPTCPSISGLRFQNMGNLYMRSQVTRIYIKETYLSEIEGGIKEMSANKLREVNCEVCFQELYMGQISLIKPLESVSVLINLFLTKTRFIRNIQTGQN